MHRERRYKVVKVKTFEELANKLYEHTWTTCSAFECGSLILANDSTSEDGAQEYVVIKGGREIESLTVSWFSSVEKLEDILVRLSKNEEGYDYGGCELLQHENGYCPRCA